MITNVTTSGDISQRTAVQAAAGLLKRAQFILVVERFGQAKELQKNHGTVMKFRRYEALRRATAPLAEGVTPEGQKLTYTDYTATLEQYGDRLPLTDVVADTHEDPVLQEMQGLLADQAAESIEVARFNVLKGGTNVFYAGAATTRESLAATISRGDLRKVERHFGRYGGKEIGEIVKATAMVATEPVAPAYFAICHTDMRPDIKGINDFTPAEKYSSAEKALPGEFGKAEETRFIATRLLEPWQAAATDATSTNWLVNTAVPSTAGYPDVYPVIVLAKDAYGIVRLQGMNSVQMYVVNPNKVAHGNELAQIGFASWKTWNCCVILNQNWIARIECLCTANPS
jgi:N4-gp56 family major capsid protein